MNPTAPTQAQHALAIRPTGDQGGQYRDPGAEDRFRRVLEQKADDAGTAPDDEGRPDDQTPTAPRLQLQPDAGRKNYGSHSQHIDVVA